MMNFSRKTRMLAIFTAISVCGAASISAADDAAAQADTEKQVKNRIKEVKSSEIQMRQALLDELMQQRTAISKMVAEKKFPEANLACTNLINQISAIPGDLAKSYRKKLLVFHAGVKEAWIKDIMTKAQVLFDDGKYEEAIALSSTVSAVNEAEGSNINGDFIKKCRSEITARDYRNATDINNFDKNYESDENAIRRLMREAETLYSVNKYEEAVKKLEQVYLIDPFNVRATTLLEKTYRKVFSYGRMRQAADVEALAGMYEWSWVEPITLTQEDNKVTRPAEVKNFQNSVAQKMEQIIFPVFELKRPTPVVAILKELTVMSKTYDPEGVGVVFIPQEKNISNVRKVTMNFSNISLEAILHYLCMNTGLKYKVEDGNIIVGTEVDDLKMQKFSVRDDMIADITGMDVSAVSAPAGGEGGGMPGAGAAATTSASSNEASEKMRKYFENCGISFPAGSSISYSSHGNRLTVVNTENNLRKLDELLRQLSVIETPMIMTELKIIEINEKDFNELGFNWTFSLQDGKASGHLGSGWGLGVDSSNMRFGSDTGFDFGNDTALVSGINFFPKFEDSILGAKPTLNLTIHALSKNSRSELLSTPRLIAKSGDTATMKMVTKTRYPDSWEAPEINSSSDNISTVSLPVPDLGDDTEVGIIMNLTPTVGPDNYTITLDLHPEIIAFTGKSSYPVAIQQGVIDPNTGAMKPTLINRTFDIWMPEFTKRNMDVKVKVCDGETIVLGGVINNSVKRVDDKLPLLGSIPLIGRLFEERASQSQKVNLLIFVTARLINNDGMPLRRAENNGMPSFTY